jgi:hypothetical protein
MGLAFGAKSDFPTLRAAAAMSDHYPVIEARTRVRLADRFLDRAGRPISLDEWAVKRRDPDYCRVGYWEGEGGAWVYTFWMGLDVRFGVGSEPAIFDTHVSALVISHTWNGPARPIPRVELAHYMIVSLPMLKPE